MENNEDEYLMLSGIQHFLFCKRQWALIHIEQQWEENYLTLEGQFLHQRADDPSIREKRGEKLIIRGLPIHYKVLRLSGICDVVEMNEDRNGVEIQGTDGRYIPTPVEYKRGKPNKGDADIMQLVAQVICLEEMLVCEIHTGFLYYAEVKRRMKVSITQELKERVKEVALEMNLYYERRHTPKVKAGAFCNNCSLRHICLPKLMVKKSVKSYIEGKIGE